MMPVGATLRSLAWGSAFAIALAMAAPAAAEPVAVKAGAHDGYGRIVFNWPSPVPFTAEQSGRSLIVRFQRPIETSLDGVVRALGKYMTAAETGADGRSVRFATSGDFGVRSFNMGPAVVVDLLDQASALAQTVSAAATESAQAARASASTPAGDGPPIVVRIGEHEGYSRIVFDWPREVAYRVSQNGSQATITFDRPARLALADLTARPPKFVQAVADRSGASGAAVALTLAAAAKLRDFRSGSKVVIDVLAPSEQPAAAQATPQAATAPPTPQAAAAAANAAPPAVAPKPVASTSAAAPSPAPATGGGPTSAAAAPAADVAAARPKSLDPMKPTSLVPPARTAAAATPAAAPHAAATDRAATPPAGAPAAGPSTGAAGLTVKPVAGGAVNTVNLRFDWDEPVAAAVFRRASSLWVVFDKASTPDLASLRAAGGNVIRNVEKVESERGTALRLDTVASVNPTIRRDGLAWILEFRQQPLQAPTPIEPNAEPNSAVGARVFLPVPEPGEALAVRDPEVGDNLVVVPVVPLGHGVNSAREYPEFRLLPSAQGIVVKPRVDDLRVRPLRQGVELTSANGLHLSAVTAKEEAGAKLGPMRALTRVFDFEKWRQGGFDTYIADKQRLQLAIAGAKDKKLEQARLDLARYYFTIGFAAESLGVLQLIAEANAERAAEPEFLALRGANEFLMGHYAEAAADLGHAGLDDNDEAKFWRAALAAVRGDSLAAARGMGRATGIIRPYPKALKMAIGKLVVQTAIDVGDIKVASDHLKALAAETPTPAEASELAYLEGKLRELAGDFDGAVTKWEEAETGPHRPSRAKATVARVELLLKLREIGRPEAIEAYEKLRFAWRGDDFEFNMLRRLGELYLDEGDYRNGLRILRQVATHFREHPGVAQVTQRMADAFAEVFFGEGGKKMSPVATIALYDEFKELTPAGARGDDLIRRLAEKLVAVDLLGRAASLLESQVKFRLQGEQKSRVGARLASVYMLDRKFEKAIETLDATDVRGVPGGLAEERLHMRARALADLGRKDQAVDILKEDKSAEADLLRLEIYWEKRDWPNSAQVLARLIREFGAEPGKPVDEAQGRFLLNYAVALTLSGNERGLTRLRQDYEQAMEKGPFRDAFRLIASPKSQGLVDYRTIAGKVADVENFQGFMAAYRERLKTEGQGDATTPKS